MKTEMNEAFTDSPPELSTGEKLAPLSPKISGMLGRALDLIGEASEIMTIAAYVAVSRRIARPTMEELEEIMFELSDGDVEAITDYCYRVIDRRNASQVEVAETPGK